MAGKPERHLRILRILRNRVVRGMYSGRMPGGRALAEEFGVDPKTVFLALAKLEAVGLVCHTEKRGTFAVSPDERLGRSPLVFVRLVHVPPFDEKGKTDLWAAVIVYGLQKAAAKHNVRLMLEYPDSLDTVIEEIVRDSKVSGCVGTCFVGIPMALRHTVRLADASGPVIIAEGHTEESAIPSVMFDQLDAGRMAAEHLVKLGHRRVAFVSREPATPNLRARLRGAEEYLRGVGLSLSAKPKVRDEDFAAMEDFLQAPDRPSAVILDRARSAEVLVGLAARHGVRVPEDLSVISFGEIRAFRRPEFTLVASDYMALGERVVEMLFDENIMASPRLVLLPVKLVDCGTTAPPSR